MFKVFLRFLTFFLIFYISTIYEADGTTHWVVTDDGKVQAQMDSLFQLRRPYDFLALAQQEQRAVQVEDLKQKLIKHKEYIDANDEKEVHLEERIYQTDADCLLAGRRMTQFDLNSSTTVPLAGYPELNLLERIPTVVSEDLIEDLSEPDCNEGEEIPEFNMAALDHMLNFEERMNLTGEPEKLLTMDGVKDLPEEVSTSDEEEERSNDGESYDSNVPIEPAESPEFTSLWGDRVARAMQLPDGRKDWLIYSLALQFWRIRGDAVKAMECSRKALYFVPRKYRHIPLVQLGNVLHRSRMAQDAAIVLHMALDHKRTLYSAHITLGHVYATLASYNVSEVCYINAGVVRPGISLPRRLRHAVRCHAHVEDALQQQQISLEKTLGELQLYQQRHEEWVGLQQKMLLEQATPEMKLESRLEYEEQKIRESSDGRGQDCFQYQQDGHTFLSCNMRRDQLEHRNQPPDLSLDVNSLMNSVQGEAQRVNQLRSQSLGEQTGFSSINNNDPLMPIMTFIQPLAETKSNSDEKTESKGGESADELKLIERISKSVTTEECQQTPPLPNWDSFPPVIFTPSYKDYISSDQIKELLSYEDDDSFRQSVDDIGMPFDDSPEIFHPPICDRLDAPLPQALEKVKKSGATIEKVTEAEEYLLQFTDSGNLNEVGHRIAKAIEQKRGPKWVVHNLASLYWRAIGNLWNGIECLRSVIGAHEFMTSADEQPKEAWGVSWERDTEEDDLDAVEDDADSSNSDVSLGNLASILYAADNIDDASSIAKRAAELSSNEGEIMFLLGNLLSAKGNITGAYYSYLTLHNSTPAHPHSTRYMTALACHALRATEEGYSLPLNGKGKEGVATSSEGTCESSENNPDVNRAEDAKCSHNSAMKSPANFEQADKSSDGLSDILPVLPDSAPSPTTPPTPSHQSPESLPTVEDDPLPDHLLRGSKLGNDSPVQPPVDPHFCEGYKRSAGLWHFTPTWLSVSAKFIDVSLYLEPTPTELPEVIPEPICAPVNVSLLSLDHLAGIKQRHRLPHRPEPGLLEALRNLVDPPNTVQQMAYVLHRALINFPPTTPGGWAVLSSAALYWRVEGSAHRAIDCLRSALYHSPREQRDVPLISLANVLHRSGLLKNALVVAHSALEISPNTVVTHFTLANIYSAMDEFQKAGQYYQSTLSLQSTFEPARDRLKMIQCDKWWE